MKEHWDYWVDEKNCSNCMYNLRYFDYTYSRIKDFCSHPKKDGEQSCHDPDVAGEGSWRWWEEGSTTVQLDRDTQIALIAKHLYNQLKAKFFNVLESQVSDGKQLAAAKRLTEDIISNLTSSIENHIRDTIDDWFKER